MAAKLYVGNLAYAVTDDRLQEHFAQHGSVVSAQVITDKFSGRSKGFGFVEMASAAEAAKALNALNGTDFEWRSIVVSEARRRRRGRAALAVMKVAAPGRHSATAIDTNRRAAVRAVLVRLRF